MRPALSTLSLFAFIGMALTGCIEGSPSRIRYSSMVPAARPIPFDGRTAEKGTVRAEGTFTHENVVTNDFPVLHDSAIHVAATTVEGALSYAVHDHVELGMRVSYADYSWTKPTSLGTPPLLNRPSQVGFGPELRLAFPLDPDKRWVLGTALNLMNYTLPTATWELTSGCTAGPNCYVDSLAIGGPRSYTFRTQTNESTWLASLSVLLSYAFNQAEFGHVFGGFSFHPTFGNDGFTETATGGRLKKEGWLPIVTAGYGIRLSPARISASLFLPLGGDSQTIRYNLGGPSGSSSAATKSHFERHSEREGARRTLSLLFTHRPTQRSHYRYRNESCRQVGATCGHVGRRTLSRCRNAGRTRTCRGRR